MDPDRFDAWARRLVMDTPSRRRFLRGLGGALAAGVLGPRVGRAAACADRCTRLPTGTAHDRCAAACAAADHARAQAAARAAQARAAAVGGSPLCENYPAEIRCPYCATTADCGPDEVCCFGYECRPLCGDPAGQDSYRAQFRACLLERSGDCDECARFSGCIGPLDTGTRCGVRAATCGVT